ncbi:hypothetical protein COB64_03555 [Candidatus Wolfebacteria bacterium]|nr:MAG: hypothetical protein COB64_03555 [Candidatus Wolfebacteria bacterium]
MHTDTEATTRCLSKLYTFYKNNRKQQNADVLIYEARIENDNLEILESIVSANDLRLFNTRYYQLMRCKKERSRAYLRRLRHMSQTPTHPRYVVGKGNKQKFVNCSRKSKRIRVYARVA